MKESLTLFLANTEIIVSVTHNRDLRIELNTDTQDLKSILESIYDTKTPQEIVETLDVKQIEEIVKYYKEELEDEL